MVFLKSKPTIDVPRGTITPPFTLLYLYKSLADCVKSKLESNVKFKVFMAEIPTPGRLSMTCSPGIKRIVVFSTSSLLFPLT